MERRDWGVALLDIEGTTTPISFVYDVLFPYARARVGAFLEAHGGEEEVRGDLALFRADVARMEACPPEARIPGDEAGAARVGAGWAAHVRWQMDQDLKTTGLKSLQGKIWRAGYAQKEILGEVFEDVPRALARWRGQGRRAAIYSSGSVEAQRLLFGHARPGDLTPWLSGYFDTTTGPKREADSYAKIAAALGEEPGRILFATDVVAEAEAAHAAGMQAVVLVRPGNHPQPAHGFPTAASFDEVG